MNDIHYNKRIIFLVFLLQSISICLAFFVFDTTLTPKSIINRRRVVLSLSLSSSVNVYNNVMDETACQRLHTLTLEHTERSHDGSSLFHRSGKQKQELTPIETAIDRILTSLNDTSPMVEYWSRSSYINMDAHADIDEDTLREDGVLRCPRNGHVLYMQCNNSLLTNNDDDNDTDSNTQRKRMGPTVVFSRKVAWGTVTPRTTPSSNLASYNSHSNLDERVQEYIVDVENYWDEEQRSNGDVDVNCYDEMTIVPAVNGRLLRFDGAAFHAVPKPTDRYLMSEQELATFLDNEADEDCNEDDDDHYWDIEYDEEEENVEDTSNQRSVILFNTWPEGSSGPRGVLPDQIVASIPDGIAIEGGGGDDDDDNTNNNFREDEQWKQWRDKYGDNFEDVICNPFEEWSVEEILKSSYDTLRDVTISLMGNPSRRGCIETKALMKGNVSNESFHDSHKVSCVMLEIR